MRYFSLVGFLGLTLAGLASAGWAFDPPASSHGRFQSELMEIQRSQLGPTLGIDQRTVDQLLQVEQRYKLQKQQLNKEAITEMQRLQQVMQNPNPREADVRAILEVMNRKRLEILKLQQHQQEEEMAILTPIQQARYLMYKMQILKEARSLRGAPGGPKSMQPITPGPEPREVVRPTE